MLKYITISCQKKNTPLAPALSLQLCGGVNETASHRPICWNIWSLVGGTVWEGLGGITLSEKLYHWGQALKFQKIHVIPSLFSASLQLNV